MTEMQSIPKFAQGENNRRAMTARNHHHHNNHAHGKYGKNGSEYRNKETLKVLIKNSDGFPLNFSGADTATAVTPPGMTVQKLQCIKTKLCKFWLEGRCTRGENCTYAHTNVELRLPPNLTKTKICTRWKKGTCDKSDTECAYAHGSLDLRMPDPIVELPDHPALSGLKILPSSSETGASQSSSEEDGCFNFDDNAFESTTTTACSSAVGSVVDLKQHKHRGPITAEELSIALKRAAEHEGDEFDRSGGDGDDDVPVITRPYTTHFGPESSQFLEFTTVCFEDYKSPRRMNTEENGMSTCSFQAEESPVILGNKQISHGCADWQEDPSTEAILFGEKPLSGAECWSTTAIEWNRALIDVVSAYED